MRYRLNLGISPNARAQLLQLIQAERSFDAMPSIVWATDTKTGRATWTVGFYDQTKVPDDFVVDADGVELIVEHQWREALDGARLEVIGGYLSVQGGKPG